MAAGSTGLVARAVAVLVCVASVLGIVRIAQEAPETRLEAAAAPESDDCATRKRAEIEALRAAGRLTAEAAMIRRQRIARECS